MVISGAGACPECNVPLRRSNFRVQLFEEPKVEKEIDIRRRILRDYNKKVSCQDVENYDFLIESGISICKLNYSIKGVCMSV